MAVHLRLLRMGKKRQAYYRIVAADSRFPRDGRFLEVVGTYNPITKPAQVKVHEDKMAKWFDQGAQASDTVRTLLTQVGFIEKYDKAKKGIDVTEIALRDTIKERGKRTRKVKKAVVAAAEAAKAEAAAKAKAEAEAKAKAEADAKAKAEAQAKATAEAAAPPADSAGEGNAEG